jgi:hypothetical protein
MSCHPRHHHHNLSPVFEFSVCRSTEVPSHVHTYIHLHTMVITQKGPDLSFTMLVDAAKWELGIIWFLIVVPYGVRRKWVLLKRR